jgi:hypothetical protein
METAVFKIIYKIVIISVQKYDNIRVSENNSRI